MTAEPLDAAVLVAGSADEPGMIAPSVKPLRNIGRKLATVSRSAGTGR